MKQGSWKKLIAPAVIVILLVGYYVLLAVLFAYLPQIPLPIRIGLIAVPLFLGGVAVYVFLQRLREVRSGEEDDLDKF